MLLLKQNEPWAQRFADEYYSLDYRIDALECCIQQLKRSKIILESDPKTPIELFEEQLDAMKKYRDCLVKRAVIEDIIDNVVDIRKFATKKENND